MITFENFMNRILIILLFSFSLNSWGQNIIGNISHQDESIEGVNVSIIGVSSGTYTNKDGFYSLKVSANRKQTIVFSYIGYETKKIDIPMLKRGQNYKLNVKLLPSYINIDDVNVEDDEIRNNTFDKVDSKHINVLPTSNTGVEGIIKTLPGVSSSNELSSQYNVRGGNFDENLVYVNGIEIYRPFLIRSGQQEGLSFVNSDMVNSIQFSAGGFAAKYGDKMSSVLDITYKKPRKLGGSATMSLLGANLHLEGTSKSKKFTFLLGARKKSTKYILNSLDTQGEYNPDFADIQTYLNYEFNDKWSISYLGNYSRNIYSHIPQNRITRFGTISVPLEVRIFFEGQEIDKYETFFNAIKSSWRASENTNLNLTASTFSTYESETFDILGQYWLYEIDNDLGSDNFGEATFNRGVGTHLNHARNYLKASVHSLQHNGLYTKDNLEFRWGIKTQSESIQDILSEWTMIDSAGFSLPHPPDYLADSLQTPTSFDLEDVLKTEASLDSYRHTAYMQYQQTIDRIILNAGVRGSYWDLNEEYLVSPRASIAYKPIWDKDIIFRASSGVYYQSPFYRELRDLEGQLNRNIKAQKSTHFIIGSDYNFNIWQRPFKLVTELYYKELENLIPYEIENVRIRYYAENIASGFAKGIDIRLNGEFVKGMESWASLSIMKTAADIENDFYTDENGKINEIGYYARPTDQRVNFSLFFQDYLPKMPHFKMHLNLMYGSGFPLGTPETYKGEYNFRMPDYKRVDIGFSIVLKKEGKKKKGFNPFNFTETTWISLEAFNLLDIDNTVSYLWIQDVGGTQFAVPNYLTSRQLNLKLHLSF